MYLDSQLLAINASFWIELVAFLILIGLLARYVYPRIIAAAEERQRQVAAQLEAAEKNRLEAEERLKDAQKQLDAARVNAQEIVAGAGKSAEQLRQELKEKAEEEAKRTVERAKQEIDAERQKAIDSVRSEVATLVVEATERVVGETLDAQKHRKLIDRAIEEVASGRG